MTHDRINLGRRKQEGTPECQINLRNRKALITFRVHFEGGEILTVRATDPNHARDQAKARYDGIIDKVKRDRSGSTTSQREEA